MSQIMELVWLAPGIQQEILEFPPTGAARFPTSEMAARRVANAMSWVEQRTEWGHIKRRLLADD